MRTLRIRYLCHFGRATGYARAAHDYLAALDRHTDLELSIGQIGEQVAEFQLEPRYHGLTQYYEAVARWEPDVVVFHAPPSALAELDPGPLTPTTIALTTWETSQMPERLQRGLNRYDGLIMPSLFSIDSLDIDSERTRCWLVPHGYDPDWWGRQPPPRTDPRYRFYSVGAWCSRKNHLGLIAAYFHAFTREDECVLAIQSSGVDVNAVRSLIARTGIPEPELPNLFIPGERFTEEELFEFHRDGDCFVSATRGEGFGLPHMEAVVSESAVITPLFGGHAEFMPVGQVGEVAFALTPCFGEEMRGQIVQQGGQFVQQSRIVMPPGVTCKQVWAEPSLVDLADQMRQAYDNRTQGQGDMARNCHTYAEIAVALEKALEETCARK